MTDHLIEKLLGFNDICVIKNPSKPEYFKKLCIGKLSLENKNIQIDTFDTYCSYENDELIIKDIEMRNKTGVYCYFMEDKFGGESNNLYNFDQKEVEKIRSVKDLKLLFGEYCLFDDNSEESTELEILLNEIKKIFLSEIKIFGVISGGVFIKSESADKHKRYVYQLIDNEMKCCKDVSRQMFKTCSVSPKPSKKRKFECEKFDDFPNDKKKKKYV